MNYKLFQEIVKSHWSKTGMVHIPPLTSDLSKLSIWACHNFHFDMLGGYTFFFTDLLLTFTSQTNLQESWNILKGIFNKKVFHMIDKVYFKLYKHKQKIKLCLDLDKNLKLNSGASFHRYHPTHQFFIPISNKCWTTEHVTTLWKLSEKNMFPKLFIISDLAVFLVNIYFIII